MTDELHSIKAILYEGRLIILLVWGSVLVVTLSEPHKLRPSLHAPTSFPPCSKEVYKNLNARGKQKYMGVCKRHAFGLIEWLKYEAHIWEWSGLKN